MDTVAILFVVAGIGALAHWGSGKLEDVRHRHWVLAAVWVVLAVLAFLVIDVAVPAGIDEQERQVHCEYRLPDCP
jgi:hypothetical protein